MTTLFYRDARVFALAILLIVAAGASALMTIGRQEDPTITNLFATIVTPFPGADPPLYVAVARAGGGVEPSLNNGPGVVPRP